MHSHEKLENRSKLTTSGGHFVVQSIRATTDITECEQTRDVWYVVQLACLASMSMLYNAQAMCLSPWMENTYIALGAHYRGDLVHIFIFTNII